jgi:predicted glycoside hydrolase/deacetylase ChbG (UPF0249 family)
MISAIKMNSIILCANDFSQSESISEGILFLANNYRINGISCLVNTPLWPQIYSKLFAIRSSCFIGLHLNLTFGRVMSRLWQEKHGQQFWGLPQLIKLAYTRQLKISAVIAEIQTQLNTFVQHYGKYPDFIDGHQHVHQLPIVRKALLTVYNSNPSENPHFFFRNTYNGCLDFFSLTGAPKIQALALLGGQYWKKLLLANHIKMNGSFAGIYDFKKSENYREYFLKFLKKIEDGGFIMCHPGYEVKNALDPIHYSRANELDYFKSEQFLEDLKENKVQLRKKF